VYLFPNLLTRASQALCSKANTNSQGPLLRNANGIQMTRLNLLLAVLTKVCKLKLYTQDVYVNITAGVQVKGALAPPVASLEPEAQHRVCAWSLSCEYEVA